MAGFERPEATLDELTDRIVAAVEDDERVGPAALLLLLRRYSSGGRPDVAETLGVGFARELEHQERGGFEEDPTAWLAVFGEAAAASDDSRLAHAAARLVPLVCGRWTAPAIDDRMQSIESCLLASAVPEARAVTAQAVDSIERSVATAYRPGAGVSHEVPTEPGTPFERGGLADHVCTASTLVTAYALSGRLPYAMLADELMQSVLRQPVDEGASFISRCDAARVQSRLAALHREPEYRRTAVLPTDTDYAKHAENALRDLARSVQPRPADAAPFGLALAEWLGLRA
ncbi:MAG TPA: hypothetical protein VM818_21580 [Vicinamibacterales bacterium]|nr:hypothetical protein [Vicinamibacterales bacterium]